MTPLEHAISYARRGWPVFPCHPATKKPLTEHGHKDATTDAGMISKWWESHPGAMIGVPTGPKSGFWVLDMDVDGEKGLDGVAALSALGMLPETVTQETPRGGVHKLFKWDPTRPVKSSAGMIGPGIDTRGDGGYAIMAGSARSDGRAYRWKRAPDRCAIVDAPTWLHEEIERAKRREDSAKPIENKGHAERAEPRPTGGTPAAVLIDHCRRVAETRTGQRNDALNKASFALGRLVGLGKLERDETEVALRSAAAECGLIADDGEQSVNATIASGLGAGVKELRNQAARWSEQLEHDRMRGDEAVDLDEASIERRVGELAQLDEIKYAMRRKAAARELKLPVAILDRLVKVQRASEDVGAGRAISFPVVEPWPAPVVGAALLDEIVAAMRTYVILTTQQADAVALWAMFSHTLDAFDVSPRLAVLSPQKRSGKTRLFSVLARLVAKPRGASGITSSALLRLVELLAPTILLDEFDTMLGGDREMAEALRGLLNSGFDRSGSTFVMNIPTRDGGYEPRAFSTWCALALAAIGELPATVADRSLVVSMKRKLAGESVKRLRRRDGGDLDALARKLTRWAMDRLDALRVAEPAMPEALHDRGADAWEPLIAIADDAGGEWPRRARTAAVALSGADAAEDSDADALLLADIRDAFAAADGERMTSANITDYLIALPERPWAEWKHGRPMTKFQLSNRLRKYGVMSINLKQSDSGAVVKGYRLSSFEDAFSRYVSTPPVSTRYLATALQEQGENGCFQLATEPKGSELKNGEIRSNSAAGSEVAR